MNDPPIPSGSEWLEALIATGRKYSVPRHGHPCRWDWSITLKSLSLACQRSKMIADMAKDLTPEQRDALWQDDSDAAAELRKALK
jgi:hypothetical protein